MPSSFRIALAITEERECRVARMSERVEALYYSAHQMQYDLEHFRVEGAGFEHQVLFQQLYL
jgi:hypothetical protein